MKTLTAVFFLSLAQASFAQFYANVPEPPAQASVIDFCSSGRFLIFTGNCELPENSKYKDSVTLKACADMPAFLRQGLAGLYPHAKFDTYQNLSAGSVYEKLMKPFILGFFFIGDGDPKGGFVTGSQQERVYPAAEACVSRYDVYGGFTSHSKYSPDAPAPAKLRGRILSRMEIIYGGGAGAVYASWPKLCAPKFSLVYPTRTFAGRMKSDAGKLIETLKEEKKKQALRVLESICQACPQYVQAGHTLARLCPPYSDVCKIKQILPGTERLILDNYCLALRPEYVK